MAINWYVIRSKPNREEFLAGQLESRGIEVFYPQLRVKPVNPRSRKIKPYFPGYLFIRIDFEKNQSLSFNHIPGAANLVFIGNEPAFVPDNIISAIRLRVEEINDAGGEVMKSLKPGDWVKIHEGPFEGYEGILDSKISGNKRVRVLLKMLQKRQLPVDMPVAYVEAKKTPFVAR